ncbi:transglycosylase SLT domain-containing protein [Enterovibrio sp. ZSDZ35]|uniref:Transglycosylase SLT domain-containing protein n=1 Tax=Enterovibrio qingdaonensis TaxID=2899818 RepID=A0ABT5QIK7_9GAMM|nr:transglycosylase SLT domain-containing protein [Enterovibrio sp. ZSDZ35]MDD1780821.1 transglycosylase SLT domain-containing protein [Enterovibrio sp. ZSDZ35]
MKVTSLTLAVFLAFGATSLPANANSLLDELDAELSVSNDSLQAEFELWYANRLTEFNEWQLAYLKKWDKEADASLQQWGDSEVESSSKIVLNDEKTQTRTVIDLEAGVVTITQKVTDGQDALANVTDAVESNRALFRELGIDESTNLAEGKTLAPVAPPAPVEIETSIKQEIREQTDRQMSQLDKFVEASPIENAALKEKLLEAEKAKIRALEKARLAEVEAKVAKATQVQPTEAKPFTNGVSFSRTSSSAYQMVLPKDAIVQRAQTYMTYVNRESQKHNIDVSLILAIMHTESHFNPKAKSHVPAYGLMQIVPTTAGHDVNNLVRGLNKPMKAKDLFIPGINVETGVAYIDILRDRYLRGIKNPTSATYAVIAAYNTGHGNVAKAMGTRSVKEAIAKINELTPDEFYQRLVTSLPYEETRNYLKKVTTKIKQYDSYQTYSSI